MSARRGVALIQALVIVAALAAVSAALMLRAGQGVARLDARFRADQAALYLDSGMDMVRDLLPDGAVHRRQAWAQPRADMLIDRGTLAWQIDDLQGRFDVNRLANDESGAWRAAFVQLATGEGLSPAAAAAMADALSVAPVLHPRALRALAGDGGAALERLLPLLAALPEPAPFNLNTLSPEVLAVLAPAVPESARDRVLRHLGTEPAASPEAFRDWAERTLGGEIAALLATLPLGVTSTSFEARLEARLDTLVLRRSGILSTGGAQGRGALILSMPGPD